MTLPPYPEDAVSEEQIAAALGRAAGSGRRVLLVFGANWCGDSRAMAHRLTVDPKLAPLIRECYVPVFLDVGRSGGPKWDAPVVQRYGRPFEGRGIPALVVLAADGSQLTTRANNPLHDYDHRHPRKLRRFLETWSKPGPSPRT